VGETFFKIGPRLNVATLALGLRPRQKACKVTGQKEARESHRMLPGM